MKKVNLIALVLGLTIAFTTQSSFSAFSERYYYHNASATDKWISESQLAAAELQAECVEQSTEVCSAIFASDPDQSNQSPLAEQEGELVITPIQ